MNIGRNFFLTAGILTAALRLGAVAVDPSLPRFVPDAALSGKLTVATGESMKPLLQAWVAIFHQAHPGVEVVLDVRDSSYPPKALIAGTAQVGLMGRLLWDDEDASLVQAWGGLPQCIAVAGATYNDPKKVQTEAIFVHRDNPIRELTFKQLDAIFSSTRRRGATEPVLTWGDLGLTGEWAARPVHAVMVKTTTGHALFFRETVLLSGPWRANLAEFAEDKVVPEGVVPDRDAIGLTCMPFGSEGARMLALAAGDGEGSVPPTLENVVSRRYPLSRLLYLFLRRAPGGSADPLVREFARVALSQEGQTAALSADFLPFSAALARAELAKLQ